MKTIIYLFPICFLLLVSCNDSDPLESDENCTDDIVGQNLIIDDSTKIYLSNYFNADKVIFEDQVTGEEVIFQITTALDTTIEYRRSVDCPEDPDKTSLLKGAAELKVVQLENLSNGLIVSILHRTDTYIKQDSTTYEYVFVLEGELDKWYQTFSANSGLLALALKIDNPLHSIKTDTLNIGNKEFYDVYENNSANPGFPDSFLNQNLSIKYSKTEGLVYINDQLSNTEIIYDRVE